MSEMIFNTIVILALILGSMLGGMLAFLFCRDAFIEAVADDILKKIREEVTREIRAKRWG